MIPQTTEEGGRRSFSPVTQLNINVRHLLLNNTQKSCFPQKENTERIQMSLHRGKGRRCCTWKCNRYVEKELKFKMTAVSLSLRVSLGPCLGRPERQLQPMPAAAADLENSRLKAAPERVATTRVQPCSSQLSWTPSVPVERSSPSKSHGPLPWTASSLWPSPD